MCHWDPRSFKDTERFKSCLYTCSLRGCKGSEKMDGGEGVVSQNPKVIIPPYKSLFLHFK